MNQHRTVALTELTPEQLVEQSRSVSAVDREEILDELYRRFYPQVARWCLRVCGDRERAADVAQEVFLRVHTRLDSFRGASRFSTWLYTVTRRVAINRMQAEKMRTMQSFERPDGSSIDVVDETRSPEEEAESVEITTAFRKAIAKDLLPDEAQVLYLHFVDRLSVPAITDLMQLTNRSGAKAQIVSAKRKLKKKFGRWLAAQQPRQDSGGPRRGDI